jgi:hypothetical protein
MLDLTAQRGANEAVPVGTAAAFALSAEAEILFP